MEKPTEIKYLTKYSNSDLKRILDSTVSSRENKRNLDIRDVFNMPLPYDQKSNTIKALQDEFFEFVNQESKRFMAKAFKRSASYKLENLRLMWEKIELEKGICIEYFSKEHPNDLSSKQELYDSLDAIIHKAATNLIVA